MQQSRATPNRILIENLYKFKGFGAEKIICELSDNG